MDSVGPVSGLSASQRSFSDNLAPAAAAGSQPQSAVGTQPSLTASSSFGLFSQLKDGAASFMKNVKDASARVVETVSM